MERISTVVCCLAFAWLVTSCAEPPLRCGEGTTEVSGSCVRLEVDSGQSTQVTCGTGTAQIGSMCVSTTDGGISLSCGPGTRQVGASCLSDVPDASVPNASVPDAGPVVMCGPGTTQVGFVCFPVAGDAGVVDAGTAISCGPGTVLEANSCVLPTRDAGSLGPISMLSASNSHVCAVDHGELWCWGEGYEGQLGSGPLLPSGYARRVLTGPAQPLRDVVSVAAADSFTIALTSAGAVWSWGTGLTSSSSSLASFAQPVSRLESGVTHIAVGGAHACAVRYGELWCWGNNDAGARGLDPRFHGHAALPERVPGVNGVISVAASGDTTCVILNDATTHCFGSDESGALGVGTFDADRFTAAPVVEAAGALRLIGRQSAFAALFPNGLIRVWGNNQQSKLGIGDLEALSPVQASEFDGGTHIALGESHGCAVVSGTVLCLGSNGGGELGDGTTASRETAAAVPGLNDVVEVAAGQSFSCALMTDAGVSCWGNSSLGNGAIDQLGSPRGLDFDDYTALSFGRNHACGLAPDGGAECWGDNVRGQLGTGNTSRTYGKASVSALPAGAVAFATAESDFSCALTQGDVYCWGSDSNGQLGNGSASNSATPQLVVGLDAGTTTAISAFSGFACAVSSGAAFCWGSNTYGQVGNGSTGAAVQAATQAVGLDAGVTAIAAGYQHACAIQNGAAMCWGRSNNGQAGIAQATVTAPVQVPGLSSGVTAIATGRVHSCAIQNAAVKCWGSGSSGQLGNGLSVSSSPPVDVSGLSSGVTALAAAEYVSCAIHNGVVRCWGENAEGSLGIDSTIRYLAPVDVALGTTPSALLGGYCSIGAVAGGSVYAWGCNRSDIFQLGDTQSLTPSHVQRQ